MVWAVGGIILGLVGPWASAGLLTSVEHYANFPMEREKIEWVRRAAATLPCGDAMLPYSPIVTEVAYWNLEIVHQKEANRLWYSDWAVTDAWNGVEEIPVPCGKD